jgi:hypothetical protein
LLAHGWWFSPGTPASSTTTTGRHEIVEVLLKVALNTKNQIKSFKQSPVFLSCHRKLHMNFIGGHFCKLKSIVDVSLLL